MRLHQITLVLLIALAAVMMAACGGGGIQPDDETLRGFGFTPIPQESILPIIEFTNSDGDLLTLEDFEGQVVFLNFWATWCPPCRAEMPAMGRLDQQLKSGDFAMIPLNVMEDQKLVSSFVQEYSIDFPIYFDDDASAAGAMGVAALPTTLLINRSGEPVAVVTGTLEWDSPEIVAMFSEWTR